MNNRTIAREYMNKAMDEVAKVDRVIDKGMDDNILDMRAQMVRDINSLEMAAVMLQSSVSYLQGDYLHAMVTLLRKEGYKIQVWNDVSYEWIMRSMSDRELDDVEISEQVYSAICRALDTEDFEEVENVEDINKFVFVFADTETANQIVEAFHTLDIVAIPGVPV
jgi:hypothetical protein